mmetsp:Transcript_7713/g.17797  ORF Transcript_7713/g.17797 Transcript_7713/m.17797 type:complete len:221 (+) Transcript_7713:2114-2776(+)
MRRIISVTSWSSARSYHASSSMSPTSGGHCTTVPSKASKASLSPCAASSLLPSSAHLPGAISMRRSTGSGEMALNHSFSWGLDATVELPSVYSLALACSALTILSLVLVQPFGWFRGSPTISPPASSTRISWLASVTPVRGRREPMQKPGPQQPQRHILMSCKSCTSKRSTTVAATNSFGRLAARKLAGGVARARSGGCGQETRRRSWTCECVARSFLLN